MKRSEEVQRENRHLRYLEMLVPIFKKYGISVLILDEVIEALEKDADSPNPDRSR